MSYNPLFLTIQMMEDVMRTKALIFSVVMSLSLVFSGVAWAEDYLKPFANLIVWAAENQSTSDAASNMKSGEFDYQQDVTAPGSANFGVEGEKNSVKLRFEAGAYPVSNPSKGSLITLRNFWASYMFKGSGLELLVGNAMSPYQAYNVKDVCDGEIFADAAAFESYQQQIRLSMDGAYFQIMRPVTNNADVLARDPEDDLSSPAGTESIIPKLAGGYTYKAELGGRDFVSFGVNAVYQTYKIDYEGDALDGESINAYLANLIVRGSTGAFFFMASGFYGSNMGDLGIFTNNRSGVANPWSTTSNNRAKLDSISGSIEDTVSWGGTASAGIKPHDSMEFNIGFAYERNENDTFNSSGNRDESMAGFVNAIFYIEDNFKITPEVKVVDFMKGKDGEKEGRLIRYGVAFQASI